MSHPRDFMPRSERCRHCDYATEPTFREETRTSYNCVGTPGTKDFRRSLKLQVVVLVCLSCGGVQDELRRAVS